MRHPAGSAGPPRHQLPCSPQPPSLHLEEPGAALGVHESPSQTSRTRRSRKCGREGSAFLGVGREAAPALQSRGRGTARTTIRAQMSWESQARPPAPFHPRALPTGAHLWTPGFGGCSLSPACPTLPAQTKDTARPLLSAAGAPTRAPVFLAQPVLHQRGPLSLSGPQLPPTDSNTVSQNGPRRALVVPEGKHLRSATQLELLRRWGQRG